MTPEKQRINHLAQNIINATQYNDEIEVIEHLLRASEQIKEPDGFDKWTDELSDTCPDAGKDNCLITCSECEHNK